MLFEPAEGVFVARPAGWVRFHPEAKKWVYSRVKAPKSEGIRAKVEFGGDQALKARKRLLDLLTSRYPDPQGFQGLNWEPFEVIRDVLRDPNHSETIGGHPKL